MKDRVLTSKVEKQNKKSVVKDDNGFYRVKLGRLNTYNENGVFYKVENLDALLNNPNSILHNRIENGLLKAEVKHPSFKDEYGNPLTGDALIQAIFEIDLDNVCLSIKKLEFINSGKTEKGWANYPIYETYGWVKPIEPKGHYVKDALDDPDINLAFSIRSAVTEQYIGGTLIRTIIDISTFDMVDLPGISGSSQWTGMGIEKRTYSGLNDDGVICLNGVCVNKLKKLSAGTENSSIESLAKTIEETNNTTVNKFFNM